MDEQVVPGFRSAPLRSTIVVPGHSRATKNTKKGTTRKSVVNRLVEECVTSNIPLSEVTEDSHYEIGKSLAYIPAASKRVRSDDDSSHEAEVPLPRGKKVKTESSVKKNAAAPYVDVSPYAEYPGKRRWTTPLRNGKWVERWESARELGTTNAVRSKEHRAVSAVVRGAVADVVVASVGDILPKPTVEKWLCLLCEYLELNADEQVLVVCLLRRFVEYGGQFVGEGDWARPQRWECVVAIACYFAVLLTEEFPGRTSMDLRELLGPNFRFGREQIAFLKVINWRITIHASMFKEVKECCVNVVEGLEGARETLMEWFKIESAQEKVRKRVEQAAKEEAEAFKAAKAAMNAYGSSKNTEPISAKKRAYAAIAPVPQHQDDSTVPHHFQQGYILPQQYVPTVSANITAGVPQWLPRAW